NLNGRAILYADQITGSMQRAIDESDRRRQVQLEYNLTHGITPKGASRSVVDVMEGAYSSDASRDTRGRRKLKAVAEEPGAYTAQPVSAADVKTLVAEISKLENRMFELARNLEFEEAARVRDQVAELKQQLLTRA